MATYFDPQPVRKSFDEFVLEMELKEVMSTYEPDAVGNAALLRLATIVDAWLVGLRQEIQPALVSCGQWFEVVVSKTEKFGLNPTYHAAQKLSGYALCEWMTEEIVRVDLHREAMRLHEQSWRENTPPLTPNEIVSDYLDDYLLECIQSEDYQRGLDMYESFKTKVEVGSNNFTGACDFGGWLCGHLLRNPSRLDDVVNEGVKFLAANLESNWLKHGKSLTAAAWLKVILWETGQTSSAFETIIRAYDFMPNVQRPSVL